MKTSKALLKSLSLIRITITGGILLFTVIAMVSCQKNGVMGGNEVFNPNGFNMDKFEQNIRNTYGPNTVGFSYAIAAGENIVRHGAMGKALTGTDGNVNYTSETRQEIFSVTKFMTTIAAARLLQQRGKTMDEPIWAYIPPSWTKHASYNTLTFRQMLSHNSGFPMEDRGYDSLKLMLTKPQGNKAYNYNNANFALCRILLPFLKYNGGMMNQIAPGELEEVCAEEFRKIMREQVLQPAGLAFWEKIDFKDWNHLNQNPFPYTRYYLLSDMSVGSVENTDDVLIAGSRGLVLSAYEVVQVMIAFEKGLLVPASTRQMMKEQGCGFDGVGGLSGAKGKYFWKNGGGTYSRGQGGETIIMIFPNSIMVSVHGNSNFNPNDQWVGSPSKIAKAYDDAW